MHVSFDANAIGIVAELSPRRALGTAFAMLRPDWMITAKHVVIEDGIPRRNLAVLLASGEHRVEVLVTHPEVDLAVLLLIDPPPCRTPLFPSYAGFAASQGLLSIGYSPSLTKASPSAGVVTGYPIETYDAVVRERSSGLEEVITFRAAPSEGGNSGSPVLGAGSGVVGVVIENFVADGSTFARATSLSPLLLGLHFTEKWSAAE